MALRQDERVMILAPVVRGRKGEYKKELEKLARQGFLRARIDGELRSLDEDIAARSSARTTPSRWWSTGC